MGAWDNMLDALGNATQRGRDEVSQLNTDVIQPAMQTIGQQSEMIGDSIKQGAGQAYDNGVQGGANALEMLDNYLAAAQQGQTGGQISMPMDLPQGQYREPLRQAPQQLPSYDNLQFIDNVNGAMQGLPPVSSNVMQTGGMPAQQAQSMNQNALGANARRYLHSGD